MFQRATLLAVLVLLSLPVCAFGRTWTSRDGKTIDGDFVDVDEERVTLKRDGKEIRFKIDLLCDEDQIFLRGILNKRAVKKLASGDPFEKVGTAADLASAARNDDEPSNDSSDEGSGSTKRARVEVRTWTDLRGKTSRGKFIRIQGTTVYLLAGARQITTDYWQLSDPDQEYLTNLLESSGSGQLIPKVRPSIQGNGEGPGPVGPGYAPGPVNNGETSYPSNNNNNNNSYPAPAPATSYPSSGTSTDTSTYPSSGTSTYPSGNAAYPSGNSSNPAGGNPSYPSGNSSYPSSGPSSTDTPSYPSSGSSYPSSGSTPSYPSATPSYPSAAPSFPQTPSPSYPSTTSTFPTSTPIYTKVCESCGKELPSNFTAGDSCPGCGVYFTHDDTNGKTAYGGGNWRFSGRGIGKLIGLVVFVIIAGVGAMVKYFAGGRRADD